MKSSILLVSLLFMMAQVVLGQLTPISFNYQGVLRDTNNQAYKGRDLEITVNIEDKNGASYFTEIHNPVTTNGLGVFNIKIGQGTPISNNKLETLDWISKGALLLQLTIRLPDGAIRELPSTQLVFVPYAIQAINADKAGYAEKSNIANYAAVLQGLNGGPGINVSGNTITNSGILTTTKAQGDLSGTFDALQLNQGVVGANELAAGSVDFSKLAQNGANTGQVIKWSGAAWVAEGDNDGSNTKAGGDVDGPLTNLNIREGVVSSVEIADGSINGNDLNPDITLAQVTTEGTLFANGRQTFGDMTFCEWFRRPSDGDCRSGNGERTANIPLSINAAENILASSFASRSDKRIKRDIIPTNSFVSMEAIKKLNICDYNIIGKANYKYEKAKGFIAQEVELIYPEAVTQTEEFIPNVYRVAKILKYDDISQQLVFNLDSLVDIKVGDQLRIFSERQEYHLFASKVEGTKITVEGWPEKNTSQVFVYGKKVNDFRVVDYDRIFTLNVSATQALIKEVEDLKAQVANLQAKNTSLSMDNANLRQGLESLLNRVQAIEDHLSTSSQPKEKNKR